jgi:hypothetical protein
MGFYVPVSWLQAIHYYYFCIGIFSFASSIVFLSFPSYALLFIVSYALNSAVCWYLSWWVHKMVKQNLILNYRRYMLNHMILAVASVGVLALLVYMNFQGIFTASATQRQLSIRLVIPEFMDYVVGFNFFAFFSALMWSAALRLDVINKAFSTYNSMTLSRAKSLAAKLRKKMNTGTLVPADRFTSYKPGSSDRVDSILMDIWECRKSPRKPDMMKLELAICENLITEMSERVRAIGHSTGVNERDIVLISNYQELMKRYSKDFYEYERKMKEEEARQP